MARRSMSSTSHQSRAAVSRCISQQQVTMCQVTAGVLPGACAAAALQSPFPLSARHRSKLSPRNAAAGLLCFAVVVPGRLVPALCGLRHTWRLHWVAKDSNQCLQTARATHQWLLGAREGCHPGVVLCTAYAVTSRSVLGCYHHKRGQLYLGRGINKAVTRSCVRDRGFSEQGWMRAGCSAPTALGKSHSLLVPSSLSAICKWFFLLFYFPLFLLLSLGKAPQRRK